MASVTKIRKGCYEARWRTPDGESRRKRFTRKVDAERALNDIEHGKNTGLYVDPSAGRVTVRELSKRWVKTLRVKPKTRLGYESLLRSRILPTFGRRQVASLKPSDVESWIAELTDAGLSPSRIRQALVVLKSMLDAAERDWMIGRNPAAHVKPPRLEYREASYFEPEVVDAIAAEHPDPYDILIGVLGTLGLRFGEAAALRCRHVNLVRRRLRVETSFAEVNGELIEGPTKSHAQRSVPLTPTLAGALEKLIEGRAPDSYLFPAPKGGPLRCSNFSDRYWHPVLEALELPAAGIHALRHSAAARMISAGASPKAVQKVLGHRSVSFTLTTYGHMFDADLDDLAARLESSRVNRVSSLEQRRAELGSA